MDRPDLVNMIRERLENPQPLKAKVDSALIGDAVIRQLTETQSMGEGKFRMSGLGKCCRALSYIYHGVEANGRPLTAKSRTTFAYGDMVEGFITATLADALAQADGEWGLDNAHGVNDGQQSTVELAISGSTLVGHPDGLITHKGQPYALLEVKSSTTFGFNKTKRAKGWDSSESYWWQNQAYMAASGLSLSYVIYLCKDSGVIYGFWQEANPHFLSMVERHVSAATDQPETVPRRFPHGQMIVPGSGGKLPWQCEYCSHYRTCWGDKLREEMKDAKGKPKITLYVEN